MTLVTEDMSAQLGALIEEEIPEGRQNLENSYSNLERVAAYCEANYIQAADKYMAFDETKSYTVQSLASVAYQINTLASNLLQMLDLQGEKINNMEQQVLNINQIIDIHKEKVARREIGILTANKVVARQHKLVPPNQQDKPGRYIRAKIDFSLLDDVGHGVVTVSSNPRLVARTASSISAGSSSSGGSVPVQSQNFAPVDVVYASNRFSSLSKGFSKDYRVPSSIGTPSSVLLNSDYLQHRYPGLVQTNQSPQHQAAFRATSNYSSVSAGRQSDNAHNSGFTNEDFPAAAYMRACDSPPLPPPPPCVQDFEADEMDAVTRESSNFAYTQQSYRQHRAVPDWVPSNYLEKVIAIYDYEAEKRDELSFQESAVIYVLKKNEDGWFEGILDGVTGLFPGNYVEPCM